MLPASDTTGNLTGVVDRPLLLNMLKPCTGLAPRDAAAIFKATALGGIDLIKDDELMGNTSYSTVLDRVRLFTAAADEAYDTTGVRTMYLPNISDRPDRMLETAQRAVEAGARALMVAYTTVGLGAIEMLADVVGVPILGHFAGAAPLYGGMTSSSRTGVYLGEYLRTAQQLSLPRPHLKPALPIVGGGVHPGTVQRFIGELGTDIVLGVGGAIQGHPDGADAGVRAMRQAVDAALAGCRPRTPRRSTASWPRHWKSGAPCRAGVPAREPRAPRCPAADRFPPAALAACR